MSPSLATRAEYYRIGLETGLVGQDEVRQWALSEVERLKEPPAEIIEVSWSRTQQSLEDSLRSVPGERDRDQAGHWLMGLLRDKHFATGEDLTWCVTKAMHVVRAAGLDKVTYYEFDGLEDDIFLAKTNPGSDMAACRQLMKQALSKYPSPPPESEA